MLHAKLHLNYRDPLITESAERGFCLPASEFFKISTKFSVWVSSWSWSESFLEFSNNLSLWTDRFCSMDPCFNHEYNYECRSERFLIRMNSIITRRIAIRTAIMMRIIIFSSLKIKFIFVISFFVSSRLKSILKIGPNIKPWFDIHLPYWSQNTQ